MEDERVDIFTRRMSRLRRVTLTPSELAGGIITQTIGGFIDPQVQAMYAPQIAKIRSLCPTQDEKDRNHEEVARLKRALPAGVVSAVVENGIGKENVVERNGVLAIDIDGKDNPAIADWEAFKNELAKCRFIAYVGLSISGLGVFALIPIADPMKHKEHFDSAVQDFKKATFTFPQNGDTESTTIHGVKLDQAPSNPASKRFVSYDPNPYINKEACVYQKTYEIPQPTIRRQRKNFTGKWNVKDWLDSHDIPYNEESWGDGGTKYIVRCPWRHLHSSHSKKESAVLEGPEGAPGFKCQHDHCIEKRWHDFRAFYEKKVTQPIPPERIINKIEEKNPAVTTLVEAFDLELMMSPEEIQRWQETVEKEGIPF